MATEVLRPLVVDYPSWGYPRCRLRSAATRRIMHRAITGSELRTLHRRLLVSLRSETTQITGFHHPGLRSWGRFQDYSESLHEFDQRFEDFHGPPLLAPASGPQGQTFLLRIDADAKLCTTQNKITANDTHPTTPTTNSKEELVCSVYTSIQIHQFTSGIKSISIKFGV